ncbi:MAG: F0F1 ATP synthase subunit B [Planctomycetota bacterium]|nr:F0F1 ATP synthase subunit B [Planctomycetota bacterium]MDE2216285.1 F0F1 ATP synthase subunit B [Planctomycetota bacterium]
MKFNIWTLLFQIINFVILLYILRRILYKPIREIIEKRRGLIAKTVEDAEKTKKEALELKEKNHEELNKAKELQGQMLEQTREEALKDRNKLLGEAEKDAAKIIEKEKALIDAEKMRIESELKNKTLEMVSVFASNLLKDISDEELHNAILRKFLKETGKFVSDISKIKEKEETVNIDLVTAYPLPMVDVKTFQETLASHLAKKVKMNTTIDKTLIAGVRIKAYDMIYDSSLAGQVNALASQLKETK